MFFRTLKTYHPKIKPEEVGLDVIIPIKLLPGPSSLGAKEWFRFRVSIQPFFLGFQEGTPTGRFQHLSWIQLLGFQSHPQSWIRSAQNLPKPRFGIYMGVSKHVQNGGTLKSSMLIRFSIINHPFWGTPIFGNTHIFASSHRTSSIPSFRSQSILRCPRETLATRAMWRGTGCTGWAAHPLLSMEGNSGLGGMFCLVWIMGV